MKGTKETRKFPPKLSSSRESQGKRRVRWSSLEVDDEVWND